MFTLIKKCFTILTKVFTYLPDKLLSGTIEMTAEKHTDKLIDLIRKAKDNGIPKKDVMEIISSTMKENKIIIHGLPNLIDNVYGGNGNEGKVHNN